MNSTTTLHSIWSDIASNVAVTVAVASLGVNGPLLLYNLHLATNYVCLTVFPVTIDTSRPETP